ncbi:hypothetical protein [Actinoplanes sp. GCM10030250]|uniref:hypothetical protein n=1 Tax=Actinoplanes sp. GCM10030250 TaxID=3273376 RepID=UPI00360B9B67
MQIDAGEPPSSGAAERRSALFGGADFNPACSPVDRRFGEQSGMTPAGDIEFIVVVLPMVDANGR